MILRRLKLSNVRNLRAVEIEPCGSLNVLYGANASGKTSLLEAIHILGRARSFRGGRIEGAVGHGAGRLTVFGELEGEQGRMAVGVERGPELRVRVGGRDVATVGELAACLPLLVINPDSHRLLEEGPRYRRQFLDWGVFHVEQGFFATWARFQRALRQRNAALRSSAPATAAAWDAELTASAEQIDAWRAQYLGRLQPLLPAYVTPLSGLEALQLDYLRGWPAGEPYAEALRRSATRDAGLGYTHYGPHRADVVIRVGEVPAQEWVSRGQQKALVTALRLAQAALLREWRGERCLLLVDDLAAELDPTNRERLLRLLQGLGGQVFLTAIERGAVAAEWWAPRKLFHVEHGQVREVV
jgi:DNA replication and repair protein RecF